METLNRLEYLKLVAISLIPIFLQSDLLEITSTQYILYDMKFYCECQTHLLL